MAKEKKSVFSEKVVFFGSVFAGMLLLVSAVPAVPWRYARTDTNVGNRFCVDRSYTLFGAGDQFGKRVGWFSLKKKMQRKSEEFGRPSPVSALIGTIAGALGAGGAATGCGSWQACKDHVAARTLAYSSIAAAGLAAFLLLLFGAFANVGTCLMQNMEGGKKKKKKKDDGLTPEGKTMVASIFAFMFPTAGTCAFLFALDFKLKEFKDTAYYPYAASHAGPYMAGLGCFINFCVMIICINRVTPFFGKKNKDDDEDAGAGMAQQGQYGAYGGYGEYPGAPGPYGPPGAYGAYGGPGAYGAPPPQQW